MTLIHRTDSKNMKIPIYVIICIFEEPQSLTHSALRAWNYDQKVCSRISSNSGGGVSILSNNYMNNPLNLVDRGQNIFLWRGGWV